MSALKEFADFVTLNTASLAETYAQLLAESDADFKAIPVDSRLASGRKLLKAVTNAFDLQTSDPLNNHFNEQIENSSRRWPKDLDPGQPLVELECLGQTLTPVVTNLEAGKFLWQMLSGLRIDISRSVGHMPAATIGLPEPPVPAEEDLTLIQPERPDAAAGGEAERTRLILDNTLDAMVVIDTAGLIIDWNAQAESIFGWSREEAVGQNLTETIIPVQYHDAHRRAMKHFLETGEGTILDSRIEITAQRRTGDEFPVELTVSALKWKGTHIFNAFVRDITEHKRLEVQLQDMLDRRASQVQTITDLAQEIASVPALDELFRRVVVLVQERFNYYHAQIYTLQADRLIVQEGTGEAGRELKEAGHQIDVAAEQSLVAQVARSGEPVLIADVAEEPAWLPNPMLPETRAELAVPIRLKDKVLAVLDVQSDEVDGLNQEDQILLMGLGGQIAVAINNQRIEAEAERVQTEAGLQETERKRVENELSSSEDFLTQTIDTIPDPIFVKDDQHRWIILNSAFCDFMGYGRDELLGKSDYDFFPEEEAKFFWDKDEAVFSSGVENDNEESFTDASGQTHVISTKKSVFKDATGRKILVGIIRDITDVKSTEKEAQSLASREQTIREITAKLQRAPTLEALAQTAAEELSKALNTSHGVVKLGLLEDP
jgi:PAS domain S-box-containing protein